VRGFDMKCRFFFLALIIFILPGCFNRLFKNDEPFNYERGLKKDKIESEIKKLPLNYGKLENYLGTGFIPIFSMKTNLDSDIDDEAAVAYKPNSSSSIKVVIFDLLPKNMIKIKSEFKTNISNSESFILQFQNFFEQKDYTILIEGKSDDKKSLLYIYTLDNNEYKLVKDFSADYSVIVDYTDVESDNAKYSKVRDIIVVNNYVGATSSKMQQKDTYVWDKAINDFKLAETSKVVFSSNLIDSSIYSSEENFLEYLKGLWYLDKYESLIKDPKQLDTLNTNNIEFVQVKTNPKEVSVKNEDYVNVFTAAKISRVWNGNIPGMRITSYSINQINSAKAAQNDSGKQKNIEVYLVEPNRIKVVGPGKFDEKDYIRFPKPLVEYITELKETKIKSETAQITSFLKREFKSDESVNISFYGKNEFNIQKENTLEKGVYKISYDKSGYLITFMFDAKSNILKYSNYIIKVGSNKDYFTLLPVKIKLDKVSVDDFKEIVFYKSGDAKK
jgi:hypothetical protein